MSKRRDEYTGRKGMGPLTNPIRSLPPPVPPLKDCEHNLTSRQADFLRYLVNDPSLDANAAAEKAGFGKLKGYAQLSQRHVLAALVRDDQFKSFSWKRLMGKAKKRLDGILDNAEASDKDVLMACKIVLEVIIKAKALNLAEQADAVEGNPIDAVLGPMTTDEPQ